MDESRDIKGRFLPGHHEAGCPKGTKQKMTKVREMVLDTFIEVYGKEDDPDAKKRLFALAVMKPYDFLKVVASLLPNNLVVEGDVGGQKITIIKFGDKNPNDKRPDTEVPGGNESVATEHPKTQG